MECAVGKKGFCTGIVGDLQAAGFKQQAQRSAHGSVVIDDMNAGLVAHLL